MMGLLSRAAGLVLTLVLLSAAPRAAETTCVSQPGGYVFCRANTTRGVTVAEQLSPFPCHQGNTWDFDKGGIWVANGCAARFRLGPDKAADGLTAQAQGSGAESLARDMTSGGRSARRMKAPQPESPQAAAPAPQAAARVRNGAAYVLVCESKDYQVQKCPVPVRASVQMRRKLGRAECRYNATWGYNYGEIWVSDGCRAEFQIN
jgi:hypothetical protein